MHKSSSDFYRFLFIVAFIILPLRLFVIEPFIVSGDSMYPTFENRDYLIVDALTYKLEDPKRGDVIVFKYPYDTTRYFIKRVIALPGETVTVKTESVTIVNKEHPEGFLLQEPYLKFPSESDETVTLKEGEFFVMGDNRPVSSDSRVWGPLEERFIVGRPLLRLYPLAHASVFPGESHEQIQK